MSKSETCCAHTKIVYSLEKLSGGGNSERWECADCGTSFIPLPVARLMERQTKFETFTMAAMHAILSHDAFCQYTNDDLAGFAVNNAKATLDALDKMK